MCGLVRRCGAAALCVLVVAGLLCRPAGAAMRADLEAVKLWSANGEGTFTLLYSDFSANIQGSGAFNNICAWDVCRGARQGLKFSNGEPLWAPGKGTNVGALQVLTTQHKVRFNKFCARSYDYDPDGDQWWISKSYSDKVGKVTDSDIAYLEIEALHDFCAANDALADGAGGTPSPVRMQKAPKKKAAKDTLISRLRSIEAAIRMRGDFNEAFETSITAEIAELKREAVALGAAVEQSALPVMRRLFVAIQQRKEGFLINDEALDSAGHAGERAGRRAKKGTRRSAMLAAVIGAVCIAVAALLLLPSMLGGGGGGGGEAKPKGKGKGGKTD